MQDENQQKSIFIDEQTQKELNTPLARGDGLDLAMKEFLEKLISMVKAGKIDLYRASTLINGAVYDKLSDEKKGKVDLEAVNLLTVIREIKDLYDAGFIDSYQMENAVERLHDTKSRLEKDGGDLFII